MTERDPRLEQVIAMIRGDNDDSVALFYHYDTNYTVKSLKIIAQFYKLDTRKLKKDDLINSVIEFEMNNDNTSKIILNSITLFI